MLERCVSTVDDAANPVVRYVSSVLLRAGIAHGFSTRLGGVSGGVFASMNLGNPSGCDVKDSAENLQENHQRLFAVAGLGDRVRHARVHQVHSADVVCVSDSTEHNPHAHADALVCDDPASIVSVRVADCVPVLLATGDGSIVAAVHAGWRGVVSGVTVAAIERMRAIERARGVNSSERDGVIAAIGPSISVDAFEVGVEVVDEFSRVFAPEEMNSIVRAPGAKRARPHIDLREALRLQLIRAGVCAEHIDTTDRCTVRDSGEFFSHRRDRGVTGRMAAFIAPVAGSTGSQVPIPRSSPANRL